MASLVCEFCGRRYVKASWFKRHHATKHPDPRAWRMAKYLAQSLCAELLGAGLYPSKAEGDN